MSCWPCARTLSRRDWPRPELLRPIPVGRASSAASPATPTSLAAWPCCLPTLAAQVLLVVILLAYLSPSTCSMTLLLALLAPVAFSSPGLPHVGGRVTRESQQAVADVNASIQEAVTGIVVAKTSAVSRASTTSSWSSTTQSYDDPRAARLGLVADFSHPRVLQRLWAPPALLLPGGITRVWGLSPRGPGSSS